MAEPVTPTDAAACGGRRLPTGIAFRGIRSQSRRSALRFLGPEVTEAWEGERPAIDFAPTAPQPATGFTLIPEPIIDGGDAPDCLSLNVFTPDLGAAGSPCWCGSTAGDSSRARRRAPGTTATGSPAMGSWW